MKDSQGRNHYAVEPFPEMICPACEQKTSQLIAGVCPGCKSGMEEEHKKVLCSGSERSSPPSKPQFANSHFADGERVEITGNGDPDYMEIATRISARYELSVLAALDIIGEITEEIPANRNSSALETVEVLDMFKRGLRVVICSQTDQESIRKLKCLILSLRWYSLLDGIDNSADLARKNNVTRQDINKYVSFFRDILPSGFKALPDGAGQRKEEHRKTFTQLRNEKARNQKIKPL